MARAAYPGGGEQRPRRAGAETGVAVRVNIHLKLAARVRVERAARIAVRRIAAREGASSKRPKASVGPQAPAILQRAAACVTQGIHRCIQHHLTAIAHSAAACRAISFMNPTCIYLLKRLTYQPFNSAKGALFDARFVFELPAHPGNPQNRVVLLAT